MKKCNLTLLYDNILVREDKPDDISPGGIHIPDMAKRAKRVGEVFAVGHGRLSRMTDEVIPLMVKVGDRVRIKDFSLDEIEYEGETLLHLHESDLLWIEREEEDEG
ncbi:hypothetical protein LCGC14_0342050 [marine sediment metagenome]|uniref:10 kDa chaperonin n=1 Tax=marine sediment metagenome TaxID=412755 RepID=A0A0F9WKZ4_9ZZZZ